MLRSKRPESALTAQACLLVTLLGYGPHASADSAVVQPVASAPVGQPQAAAGSAKPAEPAAPAATNFDVDMLKQRGLDPALAKYFQQAPRFPAGVTQVSLKLNDVLRGSISARFDDQGNLCVDRSFLQRAGLVVPKALDSDKPVAGCHDYRQDYPQTVIRLLPGSASVEMYVPDEAVVHGDTSGVNVTSGGTAALLNYSLFSMHSSSGTQTQGNTQMGFNLADWIFRSNQTFTSGDKGTHWNSLVGYAQKTLTAEKSVMQIGSIAPQGTIPLSTLYGVQFYPEAALSKRNGSGAFVQGIAHSQAKVEVSQNGSLIYSTLVSPGPFTLDNLPILNGNSDLSVKVTESGGEVTSFTVPPALYLPAQLAPTVGFSAALGKVQGNDGGRDAPWVLSASNGWALGRKAVLEAGSLLSSSYQAASSTLHLAPSEQVSSTFSLIGSHAKQGGNGASLQSSVSVRASDKFSLSMSAARQTANYQELSDTLGNLQEDDPSTRTKASYTASLGFNDERWGAYNFGYSTSQSFAGKRNSHLFGSWGVSFKTWSASLSYDHLIGSNDGQTPRDQLYLNVIVPTDLGTVSAYGNNNRGGDVAGLRFNGKGSDRFGYGVSAEQDLQGHTTRWSADSYLTTTYTHLGAHYSQSGSGQATSSWDMSGAAVASADGVTLSPYQVRDTFGIVQVGDVSGVKVDTPSGPVWTDYRGRAVIADMPAYSESRIELETKTLPRNVDINNGVERLKAGHGSVNQVKFDVARTRRILFHITMPDGSPAQKGAAVMNAKGDYVATVASMGIAMVSDPPADGGLAIAVNDVKQCSLKYELPAASTEKFYESIDATCVK